MSNETQIQTKNTTKNRNYLVLGITSACVIAVAGVGIISYKSVVDKNASANGVDKYKSSLASLLPPKQLEKMERIAQMSSTTPRKEIKKAIKQNIPSSSTPSFDEMKKRIDKAKIELKADSSTVTSLKKSLEKAIEGKYDKSKADELKKYFDSTFANGQIPTQISSLTPETLSSIANMVPKTIPAEPTSPTGAPM